MKKRQTRRKRTPSPATWAYRAFGGIGLTILLISPLETGSLSPINVIAIVGCLAYAWYCVIRHNAEATTAAAPPAQVHLKPEPAAEAHHTTTTADKAA